MATPVELVLTAAVLGVHTLLAAVLTRFFRLRLATRWGTAVYTLLLVPFALLVATLVFTGVLGIGVDVGDRALAVALFIGLPAALGVTIDVLYMTPPEEYELPETAEG